MSAPADPTLPRGLLRGAGALIALVIALVAIVRVTGAVGESSASPVVASRELAFVDRPEGGVAVHDAIDGRRLEVLAAGADGFVRGVLRSVARERRGLGLGSEMPVRLIARADGSLAIEDPATGRRIELAAFGATNVAAFARFLPSGAPLAYVPMKE
jgi:putative photosynthetic complex assembly protein